MRLSFVDIANFRKLRSVRIDFAKDKTVLVGANNSGKSSAMVAMRYFLVDKQRSKFSLNDFTLSHWPAIDAMGNAWEEARRAEQTLPRPNWETVVPAIDLWLEVKDDEVHYVQKILPTLDWNGGLLGVRLKFEPRDATALQEEFLAKRAAAVAVHAAAMGTAKQKASIKGEAGEQALPALWPRSLTDFLRRELTKKFSVQAYILDPSRIGDAPDAQVLPGDIDPIEGDPFEGLIRVDDIPAQRGFGQSDSIGSDGDSDGAIATRKLSSQLRGYYKKHLDPTTNTPETDDLVALKAIESAQAAFDDRLGASFSRPLEELQTIGYPGVTDPNISVSTRLSPLDALKHDAAVQYVVKMMRGKEQVDLRLPEDSNGLGYQNLISMIFRLMSFRDAWMRVGKADQDPGQSFIPPLHLVLVEEPEAYLHTQVQQVFIRKAYEVLRNHGDLKGNERLQTQLVVSTHSSHLALECEFGSLRYFRRRPAKDNEVPCCRVVNLTDVFGKDAATKRFVTRYLNVTHCDLLFADAAVFIEGPAERILIPHFVRHHEEFESLSESYITWLELGGSHAHRLRKLIEKLGLTTLIITDLDAMDQAGNAARPLRNAGQKTRNQTLKSWCPEKDSLDDLLDLADQGKVKEYEDEEFAVRVAYQCPTMVRFNGLSGEALANTLEDALVFQNTALFAATGGQGLMAKFRAAVAESETLEALGEKVADALRLGGKAELALDLLELEDPRALVPPEYIREGLAWLVVELRKNQEALGTIAPVKASDTEAQEEADGRAS
ncbi:MAG: AAA family ATPase [Actinobacteria bacterium]|nr:AAA family ATPase [Actinomycetota bacterium]